MSEAVNRIRSPLDEFAAKKEDYYLDSSIKICSGKLVIFYNNDSVYCHFIRTFGGISHRICYKEGISTNQISSFDRR